VSLHHPVTLDPATTIADGMPSAAGAGDISSRAKFVDEIVTCEDETPPLPTLSNAKRHSLKAPAHGTCVNCCKRITTADPYCGLSARQYRVTLLSRITSAASYRMAD